MTKHIELRKHWQREMLGRLEDAFRKSGFPVDGDSDDSEIDDEVSRTRRSARRFTFVLALRSSGRSNLFSRCHSARPNHLAVVRGRRLSRSNQRKRSDRFVRSLVRRREQRAAERWTLRHQREEKQLVADVFLSKQHEFPAECSRPAHLLQTAEVVVARRRHASDSSDSSAEFHDQQRRREDRRCSRQSQSKTTNDESTVSFPRSQGHFGQVTKGEYKGKTVAVKVLHSSSSDRSGRDRKNFVNEAMLLQEYKHKNIVKFLGVAAIRDPMMIVMELVERKSSSRLSFFPSNLLAEGGLNDYLRKNDVRTAQLSQMCLDIAKGMEYLERHNVIHR